MKSTIVLVLVLCLAIAADTPANPQVVMKKGNLLLSIRTGDEPVVKHRMDITSKSKAEIRLTQSSKVDIDAEVSSRVKQVEFSRAKFEPQFFAFRLVHDLYPNLTEPVLAEYKEEDNVFKVTLDMSDPVPALANISTSSNPSAIRTVSRFSLATTSSIATSEASWPRSTSASASR